MAPPEENNLSKLLTSSISGTSFLIAIQVFSRLFTFVANQLVLHTLSPAILGVATQLELYLISILYFSRESIRVAIQKQPLERRSDAHASKEKQNHATKALSSDDAARQSALSSQTVVNMSYLSLGLGIPLALTFAGFYVHFAPEEVSQTPFYRMSVAITAVSSLLELSVEPIFAVVQQHMLYKKRAAVEMTAAFVKSLVVCSFFAWASWAEYSIGILPFALGHLCYACALVFGYIQVTRDVRKRWRFSLLLSRLKSRYVKLKIGRSPVTNDGQRSVALPRGHVLSSITFIVCKLLLPVNHQAPPHARRCNNTSSNDKLRRPGDIFFSLQLRRACRASIISAD